MTKENIQEFAVALNSSPSEGAGEGSEAKRNKKTQLLSALLSASAIGVFLEGCGGTPAPDGENRVVPPGPGFVGGVGEGNENSPFLATADADTINGAGNDGWVSYVGSNSDDLLGVKIDLANNPATVSGDWAEGDTLSGINNLIGSRYADTLSGNSGPNTLNGGAGVGKDILNGRGGNNILEGGGGIDDYVFDSYNGNDEIRSDGDGGRLLFPNGRETDAFYLSRDESGVTVATAEGGSAFIHIADSAYLNGRYSIYAGETNILVGSISVGTDAKEILAGTPSKDILSGLGGKNTLLGGEGDDQLYGGADKDTLDGGSDNDILAGGSGDDTYRFDGGDGVDYILKELDPTGDNKVIFRAPSGVTYTDDNFAFTRGTYDPANSESPFTQSETGRDLFISVFTGSADTPEVRNTVYIDDYFSGATDSGHDIYTISYTGRASEEDGTSVSTQLAEIA